jgi:hypothetical protein
VFSADGTNAIREVPQSQKSFTICDQVVRVGVGITSCFKCFIIDLHTS